jgi:hypothetical protein
VVGMFQMLSLSPPPRILEKSLSWIRGSFSSNFTNFGQHMLFKDLDSLPSSLLKWSVHTFSAIFYVYALALY